MNNVRIATKNYAWRGLFFIIPVTFLLFISFFSLISSFSLLRMTFFSIFAYLLISSYVHMKGKCIKITDEEIIFYEDAQNFGLKPPKSVLLVGILGCGKSLTAKCIATSWNMPLLRFDIGKVFGHWLGESEKKHA